MNAHCIRYGTNKSWWAILLFMERSLIIFVETNSSIFLLNFELTKLTKEFSSSGSSSYCSNKINSLKSQTENKLYSAP